MSFNQKLIAVMTVLVVGATAAVTFVCFEAPYKGNFLVAYGTLTVAEIIFGSVWIRQIGKCDSVMPISLGVWGVNAIYFVFTLLAALFTGIECKKFVLLEVLGFVGYVFALLLFRMAEHNVEEQSKCDVPEQKIERAKVTWR